MVIKIHDIVSKILRLDENIYEVFKKGKTS